MCKFVRIYCLNYIDEKEEKIDIIFSRQYFENYRMYICTIDLTESNVKLNQQKSLFGGDTKNYSKKISRFERVYTYTHTK